jgi:hypothetical protein
MLMLFKTETGASANNSLGRKSIFKIIIFKYGKNATLKME